MPSLIDVHERATSLGVGYAISTTPWAIPRSPTNRAHLRHAESFKAALPGSRELPPASKLDPVRETNSRSRFREISSGAGQVTPMGELTLANQARTLT
jgi:hypothetical protein